MILVPGMVGHWSFPGPISPIFQIAGASEKAGQEGLCSRAWDMAPLLKEVHLKAGDAVVFTDALIHGASVRTNEGERRALIYRYSSFWTRDRLGYEYSDELVARLTPARRKIIRPIEPSKPPVVQYE